MSKFKGNKLELKLAEKALVSSITALKMCSTEILQWTCDYLASLRLACLENSYFNIDINLKFWKQTSKQWCPK